MQKPSGNLTNIDGRSSPAFASALVRIFDKQRLWWTLPQFQLVQAADRWGTLVSLAMWMLYLARPIVQDQPLPWHIVPMPLWERPQHDLTPGRVKRGLGSVFSRDWEPGIISQTARNSSGMAKMQAKEAAGAISGDPKGSKTAHIRRFYGLKLDC